MVLRFHHCMKFSCLCSKFWPGHEVETPHFLVGRAADVGDTDAFCRSSSTATTTNNMFRTTLLCLLFARLAYSLNVYLHPGPSSPLPAHLSPTQARVVVSHQLGLDGFDSLEELSNDPSLRKFILLGPSEGSFVGEGPRKALLLSVTNEVALGTCPAT